MTFKSGMTPVSRLGAADSGQVNRYRIKNNNATAFYSGQPVRVSANGVLQVATNTTNPVGVLGGVSWIDGVSKRITRSLFVPANTSTEGGFIDGLNTVSWNGMIAMVYDDPMQNFVIRADLSVPASSLGQLAQVTNATTGSSFSGRSDAELDIAAAGTSDANAMFKIVGVPTFVNQVGYGVSAGSTSQGALENTWDSARTFVQVIFAKHAYQRGA